MNSQHTIANASNEGSSSWPLTLSVFAIIFLPHFCMVQLSASSLATGLIFGCFVAITLNIRLLLKLRFKPRELIFLSLFLFVCFSQGTWFLLSNGSFKAFGSACVFLIIFFAVVLMVAKLENLSEKQIFKVVSTIFIVVLVIGWISILLPFNPGLYALQGKPVFPIAEQSHYALIIGPFAFGLSVCLSYKSKFIVFLMISAQALIFPNLTLLIFCVVYFLTYILNRAPIWLWLGFGVALFLLVGEFASTEGGVAEYFQSRLNFDEGSDNLSALVFMQGVEDGVTGALANWGAGYGFQQLGTNEPGFYSTLIFNGFGDNYNREDGSFFAAKLIAEFGIAGLFISGVILVGCARLLANVRRDCRKTKPANLRAMYAAFCGSFLVELCVRGYGYFSPSLMLLVVFAWALIRNKAKDIRMNYK